MAISSHKRRKIADFDPVRDGKTITQFCKEEQISRQTFHNVKNRITERGRSGILPDSTAPKNPARKFTDADYQAVINARFDLQEQGLDCGPLSIYYRLYDAVGPECTPSRTTIATWLHNAGLVDVNARKRPRSSYKRFARDFVCELWQIDALVYRLFDVDHTQATIYQVIDDASRFDVGTKAFMRPENGEDARTTLAAAFDNYRKPQELLSDNSEAFATYHRGRLSATEIWLAEQGVVAIAGFAPTTQGKDERSHRTLVQFLDARTPTTFNELQAAIVAYREVYNTHRRHQSLLVGKMHITPQQAWETFPQAESPTDPLDPEVIWQRVVDYNLANNPHAQPKPADVKDPGEAATSPRFKTVPVITTPGASHTDITSIDELEKLEYEYIDVPLELRINRHGVVAVCGYSLYVGLRFADRDLLSHVTVDNVAEFYTAHDGEFLFSFPLPIKLKHRPAGGQININHVEGMTHRHPPKLRHDLSKPRPKRAKPTRKNYG